MPNPAGTNNLVPELPYGDVKRQFELTREAPMSGAQVAGRALNAPRRGKQQATRPQPEPPVQAGVPAQAPPLDPRMVWQQIAQIPGASPLVLELAARAGGA